MRGWPLIKLLPQKTNFRFVKYAPIAGIISAVLCVAAIVGCFYPGLNLGIDFRGGASMEVSKPAGQVLELDQVRGAVSELGLGDTQVGLLVGFGFVLLYSIMGVPFGAVADSGNRRNLMVGGVLGWSAATALSGFAGGFPLHPPVPE